MHASEKEPPNMVSERRLAERSAKGAMAEVL